MFSDFVDHFGEFVAILILLLLLDELFLFAFDDVEVLDIIVELAEVGLFPLDFGLHFDQTISSEIVFAAFFLKGFQLVLVVFQHKLGILKLFLKLFLHLLLINAPFGSRFGPLS